jgi:putative membrane protein
MSRFVKCVALTVAVVLVVSASARAEEKPVTDKDFLMQAYTACFADVKHSELAEKQATNDKVREFARQLVKDHTKTNEQFGALALTNKLAAITGLEKGDVDVHDRLAKLKGEDFDRAYIRQMVADHEKAVRLFEGEVKSGTDAKLKEFAEKTLPMLRDQLKQAREIAKAIKAE